MSRATMRDVARLAGVSTKTVSRVYRTPDNVAAPTRESVLSAARRMNFHPNGVARGLRLGGVSSAVGCVLGDIRNPFYAAVAVGLEAELRKHELVMSLAMAQDGSDERQLSEMFIAQRVRALVIAPTLDDQSYLRREHDAGLPIVAIDRIARGVATDAVVVSNRAGMAHAVRYLISDGHRRIGFVSTNSDLYTIGERLRGYRETLSEVGVRDTSHWELRVNGPDGAVKRAVKSLLDRDDAPTALVTSDNRVTRSTLEVLRDRKQPIALIGFDDFDLAAVLGVTVVSHDAHEMGAAAARLIIRRLIDPMGVVQQLEIPTHLVARGSGEVLAGENRQGKGHFSQTF